MTLDIPTFGTIEINKKIPQRILLSCMCKENYPTLSDNFFTVEKENGNTLLICDRLNSLYFFYYDILADDLFSSVMNFLYYDVDWFHFFVEGHNTNAENIKYIAPFFNFLVKNNLILKVYNDELLEKGYASENYVYVLKDFESFDIEMYEDIYEEYAKLAFSVLEEMHNDVLKKTKNPTSINEWKKKYKQCYELLNSCVEDAKKKRDEKNT